LFDFVNGSSKKRILFSKKYKMDFKLSVEQEEALIGIMLGDGYLDRAKCTYNTRLCIEQGYPEKENYLLSLFHLFKPMITNGPKVVVRKADNRTGKIYKSIAFKTSSMKCLNKYHNLFYKDKIKIVPQNINELLTARGLAY
jgi:LAGLIDADG DNA endonuclease family